MGDRAELERARHVKHSLNDLLAQNVVKTGSLTDWASLGKDSD